jgi:hypothetical protein
MLISIQETRMKSIAWCALVAAAASASTVFVVQDAPAPRSAPTSSVSVHHYETGGTSVWKIVDGEVQGMTHYMVEGGDLTRRTYSVAHAPGPTRQSKTGQARMELVDAVGQFPKLTWKGKVVDGPLKRSYYGSDMTILVGGVDVSDAAVDRIDPWGRAYQFRRRGEDGWEVFTYGADGKEGGEGDDADVVVRYTAAK